METQLSLARLLVQFVVCQRWRMVIMQLLFLGWSLDHVAWPYVIKLLIDRFHAYTPAHGDVWHYMGPVVALWIVLWLSIELMFRVSGFIAASTVPRFEAHVRMHMFDYVQKHSYHFFADNFAGNLSNKINDMARSAGYIVMTILRLIVPALVAVGAATMMFYIVQPTFALLLAAWSVVHLGICLAASPRCATLSEQHSSVRSALTGRVVDVFSNIINVKLFARQRFEYSYIAKSQQQERQANRATMRAIEKVKILLGLSSFLFPGVGMLYLIIYFWAQHLLSLGDVVFIINASINMTMMLWYVGMELPNLFREIGVCKQALAIMQVPHGIQEKPRAKKLNVSKGEITIEGVSFSYGRGVSALNALSLTIRAGEKVGLVGFSGSGKSTLVNLLMRFFDVDSGTIRIDGQDISQVTLDSLRQSVAMIPQNPSLFHRSIRDNIHYGAPTANDKKVKAAAKHACCAEFIAQLPQGYDTKVGERGIKLSGGQRQRIAIARAILKDAPILLLDEATSALDSVTEAQIQSALEYLMGKRTTVIIAHRLSTLSQMDRILVFDKGCLVEEGTHQQLVRKKGHYAKLWSMQASGFLPRSAS